MRRCSGVPLHRGAGLPDVARLVVLSLSDLRQALELRNNRIRSLQRLPVLVGLRRPRGGRSWGEPPAPGRLSTAFAAPGLISKRTSGFRYSDCTNKRTETQFVTEIAESLCNIQTALCTACRPSAKPLEGEMGLAMDAPYVSLPVPSLVATTAIPRKIHLSTSISLPCGILQRSCSDGLRT
jgi:hypothetical protein